MLHALLARDVSARGHASLAAFRAAIPPADDPFERAVLGGLVADRLGYAFAAGYAAALSRLAGDVGVAALCVTEEGGAHPAAIRTTLSPEGRLTGRKQWATLAGEADVLLVAASVGEEDGRNRLRVARIAADAPGVTREPMPPTPFVPEIPHYRIAFAGAPVDDVLPGDGYERYVKPFRTIEDVHVCGAGAGYLVGVSRARGWDRTVVEGLVEDVVALGAIARMPPDDPGAHVALAGAIATLWGRVPDALWGDDEESARWRRDRALLRVADKARALRTEAAWRRLGS